MGSSTGSREPGSLSESAPKMRRQRSPPNSSRQVSTSWRIACRLWAPSRISLPPRSRWKRPGQVTPESPRPIASPEGSNPAARISARASAAFLRWCDPGNPGENWSGSGSVIHAQGVPASRAAASRLSAASVSCGARTAGMPVRKIPAFSRAIFPRVSPSHSM